MFESSLLLMSQPFEVFRCTTSRKVVEDGNVPTSLVKVARCIDADKSGTSCNQYRFHAKAAMEKGAVDAYYYMQNLDTKLFTSNLYWPDRHWSFVMVPDAQKGFGFVDKDAVDIDRRAAAWFFFTFYPKELSDHPATVYLAPIADNAGRPLQAGKTYKLRMPKDVPAREFWSLTVYDRATWAFVQNPLDRAQLGSFNKDQMKMNADGSVDLYFGPKAPPGLEANWIPTTGKTPYLWLRLYGPEDAFFSKTFKMPDVELVQVSQ